MKTLRRFVLLTGVALATAVSSLPAAAFIKFDGVDGESRQKGREGWIELTSVSNLPPADAAATATAREAGSGLATGRRTYEPIKFHKRIDKASPLLAKALQAGTVFAALPVAIDGKDCVLTNARITKIESNTGIEVLSISFEKIEYAPTTRVSEDRPKPQAQGAVPAGRNTPSPQGPSTPPSGAGGPP
jgi:type VI protein secretion system component Hcp